MIFLVKFHEAATEFTIESECAHKLFMDLRKVVPYQSFDIYENPDELPLFQWNGGNNE